MEIAHIKKFINEFLEILNTNRKILIKESTIINIDINNNVLDFSCELRHRSDIIFVLKYNKSFEISISTCFMTNDMTYQYQITVDNDQILHDDEILHTLTELYNIKYYSIDLIEMLDNNNFNEMKKIKRKNNLGAIIDMIDIKKTDNIDVYVEGENVDEDDCFSWDI